MKGRVSVIERLLVRTKLASTGCWMWEGGCNDNGYGKIRIGSRTNGSRKLEGVHRIAYQYLVGDIPNGFNVRHRCKVRNCVNPAHLFLERSRRR